jgi:hypothetical protein
MSSDHLNEIALGKSGRPRRMASIQERHARLTALAYCMEKVPAIFEQYWAWFNDETLAIDQRMKAGEKLVAYAIGKPVQPVEGQLESTEKQVIEVRWLPPDPNDRSRRIPAIGSEKPAIEDGTGTDSGTGTVDPVPKY